MTSRQHMTLSRPGVTPARGVPIAFLWTISVVLCLSPWTLPIAWCIPPVMSKTLNQIISTPATVPWGHACIIVYVVPPFSSVNDDPKEHTKYVRSRLILPHGVQYNDQLYPTILELWNHCGPLIDPTVGEPYPMVVVGDFRVGDPIFKECYRDSFLNSDADLARLRWQKIYLPMFQGEIPMPSAPSYRQVREPAATKQSPHRAAASDTHAESTKAKCSNSKSRPQ